MTVTGPKGEPWGLLATFDERTGLLDTFSLLRTAPWRRWQALPEPAATPAGPAEAEPLPSADAPTCRTGQKAPRAGLWEARLPGDHPLAANLHASSHRFVFARGGDPLPTVGLQPFDENMVVWIWRRER